MSAWPQTYTQIIACFSWLILFCCLSCANDLSKSCGFQMNATSLPHCRTRKKPEAEVAFPPSHMIKHMASFMWLGPCRGLWGKHAKHNFRQNKHVYTYLYSLSVQQTQIQAFKLLYTFCCCYIDNKVYSGWWPYAEPHTRGGKAQQTQVYFRVSTLVDKVPFGIETRWGEISSHFQWWETGYTCFVVCFRKISRFTVTFLLSG